MSVLWGVHLLADLGLDVSNFNSSWPLDVSTGGCKSASRSRGRSAKFELILATRCQDQGGRSAKFELILSTRCQDWGVDIGVDLPNLNSSWALGVRGSRSASRSKGRSAKFELILTTRCWGIDLPADLGVDLLNLNSSSPLDVSTRR